MRNDIKPYEDIISLPRHEPKTHPRMPMVDRAAQFSPFAALSGYEAAVKEAARRTASRIELDEDSKARIDENLRMALAMPDRVFKITYFVKDTRKSGGEYVTLCGCAEKLDSLKGTLYLDNGKEIPVNEIAAVEALPALESFP